MKVEELIRKVQSEKKKSEQEAQSTEGLLRLQETLRNYTGEYQLVWSETLAEELKTKPRTSGHKIGVERFDEITNGFREQQLITLSGHSKHGKTASGIYFMNKMEELNPVLIPLEQSGEELIQQRLENDHFIPRFLSPRRLASQVTVDWIEERIIEGIAKYNTKFVVIDHLGYIDEDEKHRRENQAYRIEQTMKGLKNVAKRWNVVVMVLVHISQHDEGKPPTLQDLKGSSSILQESDMVLMVWRKNDIKDKIRVYEEKTMFSVLANRFSGKVGNVGMIFDRETGGYKPEYEWVDKLLDKANEEITAENAFNGL